MTLQGKIAELESKLDHALSPKKGAGTEGDGHVMKTMMLAQTGVMTLLMLLIFVLIVLLSVLIKNGGGFWNFVGL